MFGSFPVGPVTGVTVVVVLVVVVVVVLLLVVVLVAVAPGVGSGRLAGLTGGFGRTLSLSLSLSLSWLTWSTPAPLRVVVDGSVSEKSAKSTSRTSIIARATDSTNISTGASAVAIRREMIDVGSLAKAGTSVLARSMVASGIVSKQRAPNASTLAEDSLSMK